MVLHSSNGLSFCEISTRTTGTFRAQVLSLGMHSLLALILVMPVFRIVNRNPLLADEKQFPEKIFFPRGGGGSGGERNPIPATQGRPPVFARFQFTPPAIPHNANPRLVEPPTLLGQPNITPPNISLVNPGDPSAAALTGSAGPGGGNGFGPGCCGGVGPGDGRGLGPGTDSGYGTGAPEAGTHGTTVPQCAYCPNPTFSEEARKTKTQGVVLLRLVVTPDGRWTNIRVWKGLGLGLDEKAMETVSVWRFRPARDPSGRPVAVALTVEVVFRLL